MPENDDNFNSLEDKRTNDFALVLGVFIATLVLGIILSAGVVFSSNRIAHFWENDQQERNNKTVNVQTESRIETATKEKTKKIVKETISTKSSVEKVEVSTMDNTFNSYMHKMQNRIKSNWVPPKSEVSSSTVLKYQIAKDGRLLDYNVITSSGDKYFDKAAIDALKKSAPFEPLPKEFTGDKIEVQFTFDYNVYKK